MIERTIDLDALAADLRTAGIRTGQHPPHYHGGVKLFAASLIIYPDGRVQHGQYLMSDDQLLALDIIRRHLDPLYAKQNHRAPTALDLHASLIEIFNANTTPYGAGNATCFDFDGVAAADQILQLLGYPAIERPRRDVPPAEEGEMPW